MKAKCDSCGRVERICNGDYDKDGRPINVECAGCADVRQGKRTPEAIAALPTIKCGVRNAYADSENDYAINYVHNIRRAMVDGYPSLAAGYLNLIGPHHRAVRMALVLAFEFPAHPRKAKS